MLSEGPTGPRDARTCEPLPCSCTAAAWHPRAGLPSSTTVYTARSQRPTCCPRTTSPSTTTPTSTSTSAAATSLECQTGLSIYRYVSGRVQDRCTHYSILPSSSKYPKRYPQGYPPVHEGHSLITFHNSFLILLTRTVGIRLFGCFVSCVEIHLELRPR